MGFILLLNYSSAGEPHVGQRWPHQDHWLWSLQRRHHWHCHYENLLWNTGVLGSWGQGSHQMHIKTIIWILGFRCWQNFLWLLKKREREHKIKKTKPNLSGLSSVTNSGRKLFFGSSVCLCVTTQQLPGPMWKCPRRQFLCWSVFFPVEQNVSNWSPFF